MASYVHFGCSADRPVSIVVAALLATSLWPLSSRDAFLHVQPWPPWPCHTGRLDTPVFKRAGWIAEVGNSPPQLHAIEQQCRLTISNVTFTRRTPQLRGPLTMSERSFLPEGEAFLIPLKFVCFLRSRCSVRENSLPRIDVIEDEMDTSIDDRQVPTGQPCGYYPNQTYSAFCSSFGTDYGPDSSDDYESEDETGSAPSIRQ